jgi:hypothetical protein
VSPIKREVDMPGKSCLVFFICALAVLVGGCPFAAGPVYKEDLTGGYVIAAMDIMEDAALVRKLEGGSNYEVVVSRTVFAYAWNDEFIIVKQHPWKDRKADTGTVYWHVVEVASDAVHGPLGEDELKELQAELGIPTGLRFKAIN